MDGYILVASERTRGGGRTRTHFIISYQMRIVSALLLCVCVCASKLNCMYGNHNGTIHFVCIFWLDSISREIHRQNWSIHGPTHTWTKTDGLPCFTCVSCVRCNTTPLFHVVVRSPFVVHFLSRIEDSWRQTEYGF